MSSPGAEGCDQSLVYHLGKGLGRSVFLKGDSGAVAGRGKNGAG